MIDRLARILAAVFPERAGEHLADALWLAATCGEPASASSVPATSGDGSVSAEANARPAAEVKDSKAVADLTLPSGVSGSATQEAVVVTEVGLRTAPRSPPPTLTAATAFSLFRQVHRPGHPVVDVDATVEATADAQRLVVVTRPERAPGLDVAIVVDQTLVTLVWADAIAELEGTIRRTGAFRSVSRWSLDRSAWITSVDETLIRDNTGAAHHARHIIDPAGRRLVLLLTDGSADHWHQAQIWQMLRQWAEAMPTALVHLLPESYWGYTAIGQPTAIIRTRRPAAPNSSVEVRAAWWSDEDDARTGVPVPVIEPTPDAIARWSRAVVTGSTWTEAIWTHLPQAPQRMAEGELWSAADQLLAFQTRASSGAQRLARILAGAPLLSLPLMRVLHEHLVSQPAIGQMAELLVSGLLENLPDNPGHGNLLLRFRPGVADLLYQGTTTSQEWDVYEFLTRYLERTAVTGNAVGAVLADPSGTASAGGELIPFAAMGRGMALRLGLDVGGRATVTAVDLKPQVTGIIKADPEGAATQIQGAGAQLGVHESKIAQINRAEQHGPGEDLADTVIDTALFKDNRQAHREIQECIERSALIPNRYRYSSEAAAALWLLRSEDSGYYSHQRKTAAFWAGYQGRLFTEQVLSNTSNESFDYISFGPSNGVKEAEIILDFMKAGVRLVYYPYDTSLTLVSKSVERVHRRTAEWINRNSLRIKAVIADIRDLNQVRNVFQHRPVLKLFSMLGTLSNLDHDVAFLINLHQTMDEGDLLMLEVHLKSADDELENLISHDSLRQDFAPLEHYFGMDWDSYEHHVSASLQTGLSRIANTETVVSTYTGRIPSLGGEHAVRLHYIHLYDPAALLQTIREIGFNVLHEYRAETFLECLLRRE